MNLRGFSTGFRPPPGTFLLVSGGRCPTAGEAERLIKRVAIQSPPPRLHCFLGKRNVFESEAILGALEKHGFKPTFSPGGGGRLGEEEIFHLANFLDVLRTNYEFDEPRRDYYRRWRDELLITGHSDRQPDEMRPRRAALPLPVRLSRLLTPFRRNGAIARGNSRRIANTQNLLPGTQGRCPVRSQPRTARIRRLAEHAHVFAA